MSSARTIAKNFGVMFFGRVVSSVLSFFIIVAIARYLGDVGLGKYSFGFAFVGLFLIFSDFGVETLAKREVARDKKKARFYLDNLGSIRFFFGIVIIILSTLAAFLIGESFEIVSIVFLVAIAMFLEINVHTFRTLFQAYEIMEYDVLTRVVERIFTFAIGIIALALGYGLITFLIIIVIGYLISLLIGLYYCSKKIMRPRINFNVKTWIKLIRKSLPFWLTLIFVVLYFRIDTVMLSLMQNYAVTGWYNAAYRIVNGLLFIAFVLIIATFPAMSKFHISSKKKLRLLYEKSFYYLIVLGVPIAIGIAYLARRFILFIYKEAFSNSVIALQILIWALIFMFVNLVMGYLLNSIDKQKLFTLSTGISAVFNVIANFILIPLYSYKGAAITTVATSFLNFLLLYYFTSKYGYKLNLLKILYKPIIASIIMFICIYYLQFLHIIMLVASGALVYFAVLFIIKGFGKDEIDLVKSVLLRQS